MFSTSYAYRGNLTKVRRWRNLPTEKWIETTVEYDIAGNAVKATDALGNHTTLDFTDAFSNNTAPELSGVSTFAFVSTANHPLSQSVSSEFDYYIGRPTEYTDLNGVTTTYDFGDDDLDRLVKAVVGANEPSVKRQKRFEYRVPNGSTVFRYEVVTFGDQYAFQDEKLNSRLFYDNLGRNVGAQRDDCATRATTYDRLSRVKTTSNPIFHAHSSGACYDITTFPSTTPVTGAEYLDAGRTLKQLLPGGAESRRELPRR